MTATLMTRAEELVAEWRTSATSGNPAGPLFSTPFTEADLTTAVTLATTCSSCTASRTAQCC